MKKSPLLLFLAMLSLAIPSAFAGESPLELRLIVPEGTAGAVKKNLPGRDPAKDKGQELSCDKEVLLDQAMVKEAQAHLDPVNGWYVTIILTEQGKQRFGEVTTKHVHERIGILSSGQLLSAPMVQEPITGGTLQISGAFTEAEAKDLAKALMKASATTTSSGVPTLAPNAPNDKPVHTTADAQAALRLAIAPYVEKARATYPDAKKRYLAGLPPKHVFFLTIRLHDDRGRSEQVFVAVKSIVEGKVSGVLASQVDLLSGFKQGDRISFPESEMMDWLISKPDGTEEGNVVGNFLDTYKPKN